MDVEDRMRVIWMLSIRQYELRKDTAKLRTWDDMYVAGCCPCGITPYG
jgi:hypothetical protein